MSAALKELPRLTEVPGGLLGRLISVKLAIKEATQNVRTRQLQIKLLL